MLRDIHSLIEKCIRREDKAWEEFIERFSGLLYYSARENLRKNGFIFSQQDIEDIVQSTFLDIWQKNSLEGIRQRRKIAAWLSITAQRKAINYMRQKKERLLLKEEFYRIDNIKIESDGELNEGMVAELEKLIEGFDDRERIILKLNMLHGKTHREIAGFMDIPINTVSTIIARKKKILKEKMRNF
jgi:RNA polymerase sigma-70 factor (ECF subfamily)